MRQMKNIADPMIVHPYLCAEIRVDDLIIFM